MKKLLYLLPIAISIVACSSDEPLTISDNDETKSSFLKRTEDDAISLASQYAGILDNSNSRTGSKKIVNKNSIHVIGSYPSRTSTDTLIYAIDYQDNNGFILISANKTTK